MNGIHDMGGMHGHGPIALEADEPVFHESWEGRMFGLSQAVTGHPSWSADRFRFSRETMPPAAYLEQSYYAHWLYSYQIMLIAAGHISAEELESGTPAPGGPSFPAPLPPSEVPARLRRAFDARREIDAAPRFALGQEVRTRNLNPAGHTRLPRYARTKLGVIRAHRGAHVLPDKNAHGGGESPEHLYSVSFAARELWGEAAAPKDQVILDCWESYLEPA